LHIIYIIKNAHLYLLYVWKGEHISMFGIFTIVGNLMLQGNRYEEDLRNAFEEQIT